MWVSKEEWDKLTARLDKAEAQLTTLQHIKIYGPEIPYSMLKRGVYEYRLSKDVHIKTYLLNLANFVGFEPKYVSNQEAHVVFPVKS